MINRPICWCHLGLLYFISLNTNRVLQSLLISFKRLGGRGSRVESMSAHCAGGLLIESWQPTSVTNMACRERDWLPCHIHAYTVYTPIGGKGRCRTRCDLQDHSMQARKSAGKISTLDLKPMRKDTRSSKQEQSVAPQNGPWSRQKI